MLARFVGAVASVLILTVPSAAFADFLGLYLGAGVWNNDFNGDVLTSVDVDDQLGISGDSSYDIYVAFEHPVPLVPNVRLAQSSIKDSGQGTVLTAFTFGGTTFAPTDVVGSKLDLTYTDLTLYYEVWDTGFDLDLGLTARKFNGALEINADKQNINAVLPMLYVGGKVGLPFSGLYLAGTANGLLFRGSSLTDLALKVGWETDSFIFPEFGIEGGYRRLSLNVDESDADVEMDVGLSGLFVNLVAHF